MNSSKSLFFASVAALGLTGGVARAQVAHMFTELGPTSNASTGHRVYMPSAAFPAGDSTVNRSYSLTGLTAALAANPIDVPGVPGVRDAGITVDQQTGDVWSVATDLFFLGPCGTVPPGPCGFARQPVLSRESHPDYAPIVAQSQNIAALMGGNAATGIHFDSSNTSGIAPRVLFVLDTQSQVHFLQAAIPSAVLAPPITLVTGSTQQPTGISYDPATASLWVTMLDGTVFQTNLAGAVINVFTPTNPTFLANSAQAFGIAYNSSNGVGSFPAPGCSAQVQGAFNVSIVDRAGQIYDVLGGGTIAPPPGITSNVFGLCVSADQQDLGGADPNLPTRLDLDAPLTNAFPAANFVVSGMVPGGSGILGFDLCPTASPIPTIFGTAWLDGASPTVGSVPFGPANGAGAATLPGTVFIGAPPGIQLTFQAYVLNPGTSFSNAITTTVGLR